MKSNWFLLLSEFTTLRMPHLLHLFFLQELNRRQFKVRIKALERCLSEHCRSENNPSPLRHLFWNKRTWLLRSCCTPLICVRWCHDCTFATKFHRRKVPKPLNLLWPPKWSLGIQSHVLAMTPRPNSEIRGEPIWRVYPSLPHQNLPCLVCGSQEACHIWQHAKTPRLSPLTTQTVHRHQTWRIFFIFWFCGFLFSGQSASLQ